MVQHLFIAQVPERWPLFVKHSGQLHAGNSVQSPSSAILNPKERLLWSGLILVGQESGKRKLEAAFLTLAFSIQVLNERHRLFLTWVGEDRTK